MDPIELLKNDHDEVEDLFEQYEKAGDNAKATKQGLFEQIREALTVHMDIEETIFYPAVKAVRDKEVKDLVREADEEHHVVKILLGELSKMSPSDEQFDAKMTVLKENIEHHVEEEESELLPDAKKQLSAELLEQLGDEMEERKEKLLVRASAN
ncbi:MAG: hemerythrin domain-containing protein [Acidobacteriota bacterium]|nr:hemerythrin domain-containing protein [Acidobacteriota bacterium]